MPLSVTVVFGTDMSIDGLRQRNCIGSLEGDGQLVRRLAVLVLQGSIVIDSVEAERGVGGTSRSP